MCLGLRTFTTLFATRYFDRNSAVLRTLVGRFPRGKAGVTDLLVLIPFFALTVGVLQAALLVGALTLELPINRLTCAAELVAAVAWIRYIWVARHAQHPTTDPIWRGTVAKGRSSRPIACQGSAAT